MSIGRLASHVSTRATPQSQPIPGSNQVPNSAGGFSFAVDRWKRLERFLILGSEGGSYYATERALTIENATCVRECLAEDAVRTIKTIVEISDSGRAPKNDPAIFALAIAAGDTKHTALAMEALSKICRIGTHIFQFAEAVQAFRGWGRALRRGVANWYLDFDPSHLAYQTVKYQQRNGWSHRDLLRLSHPVPRDPLAQAVLRWATTGEAGVVERTVVRGKGELAVTKVYPPNAGLPAIIAAFEEAKGAAEPTTENRTTICRLIREHDLPRECVPTEHLNDPYVWDALMEKMPITAMVRNLGKMTSINLLKPMSLAAKTVADRLANQELIRKSRLHPMAILLALKTYAQGHGDKGSLKWTPVSQINDALDSAFYLAFHNVIPSGKRTLLALDVSGSMSCPIAGSSLQAREAAAAMALVTAKTEPQHQIMAFAQGFVPLDISRYSRLADVVRLTSSLGMDGTDCALPMVKALTGGWDVDVFTVLTDSETWAGMIHPTQALQQYRQQKSIPAKLIVAAFASNGFSIADPNDAGMLDCVGMDANTPAVMADFARD